MLIMVAATCSCRGANRMRPSQSLGCGACWSGSTGFRPNSSRRGRPRGSMRSWCRSTKRPKRRWKSMAEVVERAGMTLWPWIEVARNPAMAGDHPEWMAAIGAHHDDWRRRFPSAPVAKAGEVIKAWPWVPIGYAPAFEAHRQRLKAAPRRPSRQLGGCIPE